MNNSSNKKSYKWLLIVVLLVAITAGGVFMFREYELSLVNALKNSYEGIEEIKITEPYYSEKPGSWSCDIEIKFSDNQMITYGINHRLTYKENHDGLMKGNADEEINQQWLKLKKHIGKTESTVLVQYSNGETGEQ